MKTRHMTIRAAWIATLAAAPLAQALEPPEEIFTQLSAATQAVPMQEEERAQALPALAYLPTEVEFALALRNGGAGVRELMRLLGRTMSEDETRYVENMGNAAIVIGKKPGSAPAMALPIMMYVMQAESLARLESSWIKRAKPEYKAAIRRAFGKQAEANKGKLLSALEEFHPAPVYCAVTARAGHEQDFEVVHAQMVEALRGIAERETGVHFVQHGPYSGLRMSQLRALELLTGQAPQDAEVRLALEQREIFLLTKAVQHGAVAALCESSSDISLPTAPEFSMLYSPKLDRSDPHMHHLVATAWVSAALSSAVRTSGILDRLSIAQAVVNTLREVSMEDPERRQAYEAASAGVAGLALCPSALDAVSTPLTMQMWGQGDEVTAETVAGARGMTFEPGKLRLVSQATAPGTFFYMESSAFTTPYVANAAERRGKIMSYLPDVCSGIALTLREEDRRKAEAWVYYMRLLTGDMKSMGEALNTLGTGLGSPFALVGAELKGDEGAWALGAAVRNRQAIADSWRQMIESTGSALGKLGLPPILAHALPIERDTIGEHGYSYTPTLPLAREHVLPTVALNAQYFVLGNSKALNTKLLTAAKGEMPFCGAVNSAHLPTLARIMNEVRCPMIVDAPCATRVSAFLRRLAERVEWVFSTSTITNGLRTARARMLLHAPSNEVPDRTETADTAQAR